MVCKKCLAGADWGQIFSCRILKPFKTASPERWQYQLKSHFILKQLPSTRRPSLWLWVGVGDVLPMIYVHPLRKRLLLGDINLLYHPLFLVSE